jgi:protein-disulfide isomerase
LADEGSITLSKDHIYGIVIVALVALLTISVFTSGFGIMPVKGATQPGTCNTGGSNSTGTSTAPAAAYGGLTTLSVATGSNPVRGQATASVTWIEFSDYQCPYCSKLFTTVYTQIESNYVNTGKVKMYFEEYPLSFHDKANVAAMAGRCAGEQGKFWEMHDQLFTNQASWSGLSVADFTTTAQGYASSLGLDTTKFSSCMTASKYADVISQSLQAGQGYGVQGTPGVFLLLPKSKTDLKALQSIVSTQGLSLYQDGDNLVVLVPGAYPYSAFASILNTVTF